MKTVMPSSGASRLSMRAKRRLHCKLQLWMWRKRREKCHFGVFKVNKRNNSVFSPCLGSKTRLQTKTKVMMRHTVSNGTVHLQHSVDAPPVGCELGGLEDSVPKPTESAALPQAVVASRCSHGGNVDMGSSAGPSEQGTPTRTLPWDTGCDGCEGVGGDTAAPGQDVLTHSERTIGQKTEICQTQTILKTLVQAIHEFFNDFYRTYGSFIPLHQNDLLSYLKKKFNSDFSDRQNLIFAVVLQCRSTFILKPMPPFRVVYKNHMLTLKDLLTLAGQNWLNDQVMNMYGELIEESSHHRVHFLNSFFHWQLMNKGYEGVKRWTKKVDLFSKSLLLVPINLEVHWCLVAADMIGKKICIYDSQGNALQKVAWNILEYLMTEAKEKKQTAFENGWSVSFDENVPQQTNENDCGVFVLEYSRRLALTKPLQFSQHDIPKIRKRIYRELCDHKLHQD